MDPRLRAAQKSGLLRVSIGGGEVRLTFANGTVVMCSGMVTFHEKSRGSLWQPVITVKGAKRNG